MCSWYAIHDLEPWLHEILSVVGPLDDTSWPTRRRLPKWHEAEAALATWSGQHQPGSTDGDDFCSVAMRALLLWCPLHRSTLPELHKWVACPGVPGLSLAMPSSAMPTPNLEPDSTGLTTAEHCACSSNCGWVVCKLRANRKRKNPEIAVCEQLPIVGSRLCERCVCVCVHAVV